MIGLDDVAMAVAPGPPGGLRVEACGEGILYFEDNARGTPRQDDDGVSPDVVSVLAGLANRGMLGNGDAPWLARASVADVRRDLGAACQQWRLQLEAVDRGALRVLANLLVARGMDAVSVQALPPGESVHSQTLPYPPRPAALPFELILEPPPSRHSDRVVQIVFAAPLSEDVASQVVQDLEAWTDAVLLGGYAEDGQAPQSAGGLPDSAYRLDAFSVEQSFMEAFESAEAAFDAVVLYAARLHHTLQRVASVRVS
jgi:hypothetical protein